MSLRDVMSSAGLAGFAEWALILFVAAFVGVCVWVLTRPQREMDRQADLPLDWDRNENGADDAGRR